METLKLITTPDLTGLGRVEYNGRYYGLPVAVIEYFAHLKAEADRQNDQLIYKKIADNYWKSTVGLDDGYDYNVRYDSYDY